MQELIVKTTLPTIEANFDIVKQQLIDGLKTYDVIITAETVKDGKSMASEINKIKKAIKVQEKKALEDILGPANEFKDKIKELMTLADEAREKITAQVAAYEEKTKAEILDKVREYALNEITASGLREPFNSIATSDLAKLTAATKTGNLTTATMNIIKGRIIEQQNLQYQEDARLKAEQEAKEAEIARIREEERIKAEAKAKEEARIKEEIAAQTVQPEQVQVYQQPEPKPEMINVECKTSQQAPYQEYPQNMQQQMQPAPQAPSNKTVQDNGFEYPSEEPYNYNPDTGEVYETPAFMDDTREKTMSPTPMSETAPMTKVKVLIDIDVDISKIPNITDAQIIAALDKKMKNAGINNAVIRDLHRF